MRACQRSLIHHLISDHNFSSCSLSTNVQSRRFSKLLPRTTMPKQLKCHTRALIKFPSFSSQNPSSRQIICDAHDEMPTALITQPRRYSEI
ncbi:hypothetical protein EYC84_000518 [Monilinia fructicola]|uniref:Uncharacterized protein n=1 Tax=Monilinia fructicola TaxID=38448 RepID=A0A5M9JRB9_MONFR|nr:hypothetical protein EYC84_000518 [Monilinia fructicola]